MNNKSTNSYIMTPDELKQIGLSQKTLDLIVQVLSQHPVKEARIFGSRAKGNFKEGSDIDLCLKTTKSFTFKNLLKIMNDFDDSYTPYTFDILEYDKLQNKELVNHINKVGKIIYSR